MISMLRSLGRVGLLFCQKLGISGLLLVRTLARKPRFAHGLPLIIVEVYSVGVLSLLIVIVSALFIGMVVALQGHHTLVKFGAEQELGQLVALSVVRELSPVVTALLFAGRAGSALTAEIALMKTTEQLASMEMMGVDPLGYIIAPRLWAGFIAMPLLCIIFSMVAIFGGYLVGVAWLGIDGGAFWANMNHAVNFSSDIVNGIIKSIVFGFVVSWISVYQGYYTLPTAEGISRATTHTVVYSSLAILALDFILTTLMLGGW